MANTRVRGVRISNDVWEAAQVRALANGETVADRIRRALEHDESYRAEIYRDGKWWMIRVPEINGLTQARKESEVWQMARELIAVTLDKDPSAINVELVILPRANED